MWRIWIYEEGGREKVALEEKRWRKEKKIEKYLNVRKSTSVYGIISIEDKRYKMKKSAGARI